MIIRNRTTKIDISFLYVVFLRFLEKKLDNYLDFTIKMITFVQHL